MDFLINNIYLVIYLGAITIHLFHQYKGPFTGTQKRIKELFPTLKEFRYIQIDFIITPIIGTLLAYILFQPTDLKTALLTGLTWQQALTSIIKAK